MALNTSELRNPALREFADKHLNLLSRCAYLGTPIVATTNRIVTSTNMKVGSYTIAAQPDVPRNITVTATAVGTADTMGTITVTGTNYDNAVITETITPVAGSTVAGTKAFETVTSVVGAGWVIDAVEGTNDTIVVGVGAVLGLPFKIAAAAEVMFGVLGTAIIAPTVTAGALESSTVDISSGTYNGSKKAFAFVVE
jgi:hypothetical protein